MTPILQNTLLLAAGLAVGIVGGRMSVSPRAEAADAEAASQAGKGSGRSGLYSLTGSSLARGRTLEGGLATIRAAMDESDPIASTFLFSTALQDLSVEGIIDASEALWTKPGSSHEISERKRLLSYRWGQLAGSEAVKFAQSQSGQGKLTAITAALAGWASIDPAAAVAWIDAQEHPGARLLYTVAMIDGWAKQDPASATQHILGLPDNPQNLRMIKIVAGEQVRRDPGSAGPWAMGLPAGALKEAALEEVATRWVWADPTATINWAVGIEDPALRDEMLSTAMTTWARAYPSAAGEYLGKMPDGPARDGAIGAFVEAAAKEDPETGAAWAATISDSVRREESLMDIARSWLKQDRNAAMEWLPQSGLSPQAQAELQSP